MYPKARFDALTDGIFGVAMTLLVLDIRLPEDFHPHTSAELLQGFRDLTPKLIPYVISFLVLGLRWQADLQVRSKSEELAASYFWYWLIYLLLITCVPFTTIVVGRYRDFAPAIWLYAGNTTLIGLISFGVLAHTPALEHDGHLRDRQVSLVLLIASSLLAVAWSFFNARHALIAFALNALSPMIGRWFIHAKRASR